MKLGISISNRDSSERFERFEFSQRIIVVKYDTAFVAVEYVVNSTTIVSSLMPLFQIGEEMIANRLDPFTIHLFSVSHRRQDLTNHGWSLLA